MPQKRYKVVFSGRFVEGKDPVKALEIISSMFRVAPERVRAAFAKGPGAVIVSTDDMDQAQRYVVGMKKAGAICKVSTQHGERLSPARTPSKGHGSVERTVKAAGSPSGALVLEILPGPTDITLTTLVCARLTGAQDVLDLNRQDRGRVEFSDVSLVSVYNSLDGSEDYRILFFVRGNKRPFGAECASIAFSDFPGVKGKNLMASLRNFLTFLYARHPEIIFDRATYDFVAGGPMPLFTKDEIVLATALYRAMPEDMRTSAGSESYGAARPEEAVVPEGADSTKDSPIKGVCPKCGAPRKKAKPACPRCGLVFVNWYQDKEKRRGSLAKAGPGEGPSSWSRRYATRAALAILLGFLLPMPKASLLFGAGSVIIWPWQMLGIGIKATHTTAMATPQSAGAPVVWSLVLVISAVAAIAIGRIRRPAVRNPAWLVTGPLTLALVLIVFQGDGFILGSIFWPPSMGAGVLWTLGLLASAVMASINRIRKLHDVSGRLRLLQGVSGGLLLILSALMLIMRPGAWGAWPIVIAELLIILFAAVGVYCALRPVPSLEGFLSLLAKIALIALPAAGTIAQVYVSHDPSNIIIAPGGLWPAALGHLKAALILGGAATVFCAGLIGLLLRKHSPPEG